MSDIPSDGDVPQTNVVDITTRTKSKPPIPPIPSNSSNGELTSPTYSGFSGDDGDDDMSDKPLKKFPVTINDNDITSFIQVLSYFQSLSTNLEFTISVNPSCLTAIVTNNVARLMAEELDELWASSDDNTKTVTIFSHLVDAPNEIILEPYTLESVKMLIGKLSDDLVE